jgi:Protein of unknown function (DUF3667)
MSDETPLILGDAAAAEMSQVPRRRWRRKKRAGVAPLTNCENCGAALTGPYCANCGQPAIDYHRSFGTILLDAADAFFNLDARFFTTFALLFAKPWRLTNDFLAGKRQRFVHPLRVYLMASLAFFLLIKELNMNKPHVPPKSPHAPVVLLKRDALSGSAVTLAPSETTGDEGVSFQLSPSDEKAMPPFARWLKARAEEKIGPTGARGDLFLKALIDNLPYMVLGCIPIFSIVLKLLYIRKRRFYIEHLIFALHTHAFVFLATVVIIGIGFFLDWKLRHLTGLVCTLLSFTVVAELLVAIRRVYRQNWFATIFKFLLGSAIYSILLLIAFVVTALLTLVLP